VSQYNNMHGSRQGSFWQFSIKLDLFISGKWNQRDSLGDDMCVYI